MADNKSNKKTTAKKSTNKKNTTNKKTSNTKVNNSKKTTTKKVTVKETKSEEKKTIVKENKSVEKKPSTRTEKNKKEQPDINEYINVLFKEKAGEKKSDLKIILCIIVLLIVLLIIFFGKVFLNNSSKKSNKMHNKITTKKNYNTDFEDADRIPIFTFHRIVSDKYKNERYKNYEWVASVDVFEKQIKYLYDNGYQTISMDEFYCWYQKKCKFPKKTVVLTFDDGDDDNYYLVLPILKKYNYKGVVFVIGSRTNLINLDGFDETKNNFLTYELMMKTKMLYPKLEFQSHTWDMQKVDENGKEHVLNMTEEDLKEDFDKQEHFGFKYLAYPYGVYTELEMKELEKRKYNLAFTFRKQGYATRDSNKYEIPRIKVNGFSDVDIIKKWLDY